MRTFRCPAQPPSTAPLASQACSSLKCRCPPRRFTRDFDPEVQAGGKEGHTRMRDACERALTAGGLHVTGARQPPPWLP